MGMLHDQSSYEHPNNAPQSHDENDAEVRLVNRSYDYAYCNGPLKIPVDPSEMRVDDITASSSSSSSRDTSFLVASPSTEYVLNVAFYSFVGFMTVQAIFAFIAKSEAMMADCEAMMVDAVTYLLNLCAEHYKNRPDTPYELSLPLPQRAYRRELQKHCLEFIPPTISVITLILVTIYTLQDSITTLLTIASDQQTSASDKEDEVSIPIMFTFSFANLILDIVNVTCFTRSGFSVMEWMSACRKEKANLQQQEYYEHSPLLNSSPKNLQNYSSGSYEDEDVDEQNQATEVNLNMCSAWTVRSTISLFVV